MERLKEVPISDYPLHESKEIEGLWLVEFKNGDALGGITARGWALALVTKKDVLFITPRILDPNGPIKISVQIIEGTPSTVGFETMVSVTAAGNGRRVVIEDWNVTVGGILVLLDWSGFSHYKANNGRGLRHWICVVLFLFHFFIDEPMTPDCLCQKAIRLMRRGFQGGDTMEFMPIEEGTCCYEKLVEESKAALLLCNRYIKELLVKEGF
ncbi:hypothetical protein ANO14919_027670 [Xylariales sp. No.14919]|nr:hypothetical protein ANO14919_027670 [Xylariales sp. No.14919]